MKVGGGQEVVASVHCANNDLVSSCSGTSSHEKVQIEKTDGSSIGQKEYDFPVLVRGSILAYGLEVEEELSTLAIQCWAEGVSLDETGSRSLDVETGKRICRSSDVRNP